MSAASLELTHGRAEDRELIDVRGDVDLTTCQELDDALTSCKAYVVVVDLGGVTFLDSAGMRVLDRTNRRFAESGRRLVVVAPSESVAGWALAVAGLTEGLVHGSLDEVLLREARATADPVRDTRGHQQLAT